MEKDENGNTKIMFDRPEGEKENALANSRSTVPADTLAEQTAASATQEPAIEGAESDKDLPDIAALDEGDKKPEPEDDPEKKGAIGKSIADDSQWKAEIGKIKQKKSQLSQEISSVRDDENKRKDLEAQLAQVETELAAKDTESYRKQRLVIRYLGSEPMNAANAAKLGPYRTK